MLAESPIQVEIDSGRRVCTFPRAFSCEVCVSVLAWMLIISPALLQSTVKLFFCPTTALDRPAPRQTTLLASDVSLVEEVAEEEEL